MSMDQKNSNLSFFVSVPAVIWQILFLYIPLFFIVSASFYKDWHLFEMAAFSLDNFKEVCNAAHLKVIFYSLIQACIVATTCLMIGYPVAYLFAIRLRHWKNLFLFFLTLP